MNSDPSTGGEEFRYGAGLAAQIEIKWQRIWSEQGTFEVPNPVGTLANGTRLDPARKRYVIDMFPYPSGAGLHVGHPLGYIASDVYARYLRMNGSTVLHPFGFDAFGLPAEQYAIETGQHPAVTTEQNIATMRRQLRRLGLTHDPRREISTADPGYYRWTQWIFLKLFNSWCDQDTGKARPIDDLVGEFEQGVRSAVAEAEANPGGQAWRELDDVTRRRVVDSHRLAFLDDAPVNWCPGLGTVLANEEVTADGRSQVGNYPVYRRRMRQWMLRITAFADRLSADLDGLDWTDSLKTMQRNWIGRSEGADIRFHASPAGPAGQASPAGPAGQASPAGPAGQASPAAADAQIQVFTTRPDTLFGATFLVLAPEHPLVPVLTAASWPDETPTRWRGADLPGVAEGAAPTAAVAAYVARSASASDRQRQSEGAKTAVFLGSYAVNPLSGARMPILISDYVLASYGTGAIMAVPAHDQRDYELATALTLPIVAVVRPAGQWLADRPGATADAPETWGEAYLGEGELINSDGADVSLDGLGTEEAKARVLDWLGSSGLGERRVSYKLRDWLFSRQRYWGEPFPIVYDETGLPIALPESMLPVELPPTTDFRPQATDSDDPRPPLSRAPGFEMTELDLGDGTRTYRRETNTMPQWAGSCWYYLRYLDPLNDERFVDPDVERFWMGEQGAEGATPGGVDLYIGGVEHAVLHLLYARFWHKVLFDLGYVSTPEPFQRLYNQGYVLADAFTNPAGRYVPADGVVESEDGLFYEGERVRRHSGKMGKSLKNSVAPDEIYESYGADTLRMYEMAMGPLDVDRPWQPDDIVGVHRFLQRLWRNVIDEQTGELRPPAAPLPATDPLSRLANRTIDDVARRFGELRFNVATARLTDLNNALTQSVLREGTCPRPIAESLVLMTFPLAPHIASELWERLGHDRIDDAAFPTADPAALHDAFVVIPVTVDGKVRGKITIGREAAEPDAVDAALRLDPVANLMRDREIDRAVFVPGKILNLVTRRI
jgi:leucyl-tRNA synthetase